MKQLLGDDHRWRPAGCDCHQLFLHIRSGSVGHNRPEEEEVEEVHSARCNQYYLQWMFWPVVTTHSESRSSIFCEPTVVFAISQLTDNHS